MQRIDRLKRKFLALAAKGGKGRNVSPEIWWQLGQLLHEMGTKPQTWVKDELGISPMQACRLRWVGELPRPPSKGTTLSRAAVLGKAHYNSPKERAKRKASLAKLAAAFRAVGRRPEYEPS